MDMNSCAPSCPSRPSPSSPRPDGDVVAPADTEWDLARRAWNLAADQRPALVAFPADAGDVVAIVDFARVRTASRSRRRAPGTTPPRSPRSRTRCSSPPSACAGSRSTSRRGPRASQAGTLWLEVTEAASPHGLFPLSGSSPDVGVVGYTLGGGLSWLAPQARARRQQRHRDRARDPRRRARARDRRRARRPVLGAARRRRQLRHRHRDRVPPVPLRRGLRRHVAVARSSAPARSCAPGATGRGPRPRRSRPRCGSCTSRRCPSCRRSCAAAPSP